VHAHTNTKTDKEDKQRRQTDRQEEKGRRRRRNVEVVAMTAMKCMGCWHAAGWLASWPADAAVVSVVRRPGAGPAGYFRGDAGLGLHISAARSAAAATRTVLAASIV